MTLLSLSRLFARLAKIYQLSLKNKMKYTLIIIVNFLAISTALKCQQCTGNGGNGPFECNGIDDNGIEVECNDPSDEGNACLYYVSRPILGKSIH